MLLQVEQLQEQQVEQSQQDNLIEVKFQVFQEYAERIRKDSVVKKRAPLIGTKYLEIIPGETNMPVLASGSYVWSEDTEEGKRILSERLREERPEQIQRILDNVEDLTYKLSDDDENLMLALIQIQKLFGMLASEEGDLNQMLANIESITESIDLGEGSIGRLLYDDYEIYNQLAAVMQNMNDITANFEDLSVVLADSSPEIKSAMENVNRTMDEAIGVMGTIQNSFWLRSASKKTMRELEAQPVEDSMREGGYAPEVDYTR